MSDTKSDTNPNAFPSLCEPDGETYWPIDPWECRTDALPWIEENWERFKFTPEYIIENFVRYEGLRPGPNRCGVYFLGLEQDIGYVGKATSLSQRMWAHRLKRKDFTHYWCIQDIPKAIINDVEEFYIRWLDPPLNIQPGRGYSHWLIKKADELRESHPWPPKDWEE